MALRRQLTGERFEFVKGIDEFRLCERINGQGCQVVVGVAQRGNRGLHRFRTHDSNICSNSKEVGDVFPKRLMRQRIQSSCSTANGSVGTSAITSFAAESLGITSRANAASALLV